MSRLPKVGLGGGAVKPEQKGGQPHGRVFGGLVWRGGDTVEAPEGWRGGTWVALPSWPVPVTSFPSSIVQRGLYPGKSLRAPGGRFRGPQCVSLWALAGPRGWCACVCVPVRHLWRSLVNPSLAQQPWPCLVCPSADFLFSVCGHCPTVCPDVGGAGVESWGRGGVHTRRISSMRRTHATSTEIKVY